MSERFAQYKNRGKNVKQKNSRVEEVVSIRKDKREDLLWKHRNVNEAENKDDLLTLAHPLPVKSDWSKIMEFASRDNPEDLEWAVHEVRILTSNVDLTSNNKHMAACLDSGVLDMLVRCLSSNKVNPQLEAVLALGKIAAGTSELTQAVVNSGAVPLLLQLLSNHSPEDVKFWSTVVYALGHIIDAGPHFRDYCLQLGILQPMLSLLPLPCLQNVTWVIVNLCRFKESPLSAEIVRKILHYLSLLTRHEDTNILVNIASALFHLSGGGNEQIQLVIESGLVPALVTMLGRSDLKILTPALLAVGNIVTGTDEQAQVAINCGVLNKMTALLSHCNNAITKNAVWVLSNIAAGNEDQIQAMMDAGLMSMIVDLLDKGDFDIQKECVWMFVKLTLNASSEQIEDFAIESGIIVPLCTLLDCKDAEIIQVVLDCIDNILSNTSFGTDFICTSIVKCGGLNKIESLQNSEIEDIYKRSHELIDHYFDYDLDEEEDDM